MSKRWRHWIRPTPVSDELYKAVLQVNSWTVVIGDEDQGHRLTSDVTTSMVSLVMISRTHAQETKNRSFPNVSLWWEGPDNRACSSEM